MTGTAGAWRWHHTSLAVRDLEKALEFYRTTLGYEVRLLALDMTDEIRSMLGVPRVRCDLAQCESPVSGHVLELIAFHDVPPNADPRLPVRPGQGHVAYVVHDLEAALVALEKDGAERVGEITQFPEGRAVYVYDGHGGVVELEEWPPGTAEVAGA